jgi:hypothetical protein
MAIVAATLEQAIGITNSQIALGNAANKLLFAIQSFNVWGSSFNTGSPNDRTVRDWLVQSQLVQSQTPNQGNAQQRQNVVDIVCRVCWATIGARADGRITVGQRDAVLAAWNGSVGLLP